MRTELEKSKNITQNFSQKEVTARKELRKHKIVNLLPDHPAYTTVATYRKI